MQAQSLGLISAPVTFSIPPVKAKSGDSSSGNLRVL
jgi:hypothetical protein